MLKIYTAQIAYNGADRIDTTIKSASTPVGKFFAPTWEMVAGVKRYHGDTRWPNITPISEEEYIKRYYQNLRNRYQAALPHLLELLQQERVTLCCYCKHADGCHRKLSVDILLKIAHDHNVEAQYAGEIT